MKRIALAFAAVAALSATAPARASVIVTDFQIISGPATGTFSLGFDTNTSLYSLVAINLPIGSTLFDTSHAGLFQAGKDIMIGGNPSGVTVLDPTDDDFKFTLQGGTFSSFFDVFFEIRPGDSMLATVKTLPEPGTWAMMLLGFGAIGLVMRRRRPQWVERDGPVGTHPDFRERQMNGV